MLMPSGTSDGAAGHHRLEFHQERSHIYISWCDLPQLLPARGPRNTSFVFWGRAGARSARGAVKLPREEQFLCRMQGKSGMNNEKRE